ncbi:MAG TPA: cyanophycinase [Bacteroidales bacterium]|nr:cyanophycinase [Bacteroidales bacterium]
MVRTKWNPAILMMVILFLLSGCSPKQPKANGKLFIIGGGNKSLAMMRELVDLSGIKNSGYMFILPMASAEPDSSIIWTRHDFDSTGVTVMPAFNFKKGEVPPADKLDSLRKARLIFIGGGDQERFMDIVRNTPVMDAIMEAWHNGAVISGTSAGAAVMSRKMITGNQMKHPGLESRYPTIEESNMQITGGMGFLQNAIVDQHFIKRQRLNRLISVSIENPEEVCIGIDESTAIITDGKEAEVTGNNQVIVIRNPLKEKKVNNGLIGTEGLQLSVYLPGQKFSLE